MPRYAIRQRVAAGLWLGVALSFFLIAGIAPAPSSAQSPASTEPGALVEETTSTSVRDVIPDVVVNGESEAEGVPAMIPGPNSGVAPVRASDRGGAFQLGILGVMLLSVIGMALWVRKSGRENRTNAPDRT